MRMQALNLPRGDDTAAPAANSAGAALGPDSAHTPAPRYYRPELDVLRFIAFMLVFCTHRMDLAPINRAMHPWQYNLSLVGVFGVPVFFLLSAFLITELLLRERARTGTVHIQSFYIRRILRIWPLYFAVFFGLTLLNIFIPGAGVTSPIVWLAFMLFAGNWWISFNGWVAYPVNPLWSISVEEQFYLAIPFLARVGPRTLVVTCLVCLAASYIAIACNATLVATEHIAWTNSFVHFQFFAAGTLLAMYLQGRTPQWHLLVRLLGIAAAIGCWLIAFLVFGVQADDPRTTIPGALAGWPFVLAGSTLLLLSLLGTPAKYLPAPIVYLGRISYGLYMIHITIFWFVYKIWQPELGEFLASLGLAAWRDGIGAVIAFTLTAAIASASYRWFEGPFLRLKRRFTFIPTRED